MATSIKIKFRRSTVTGKAGTIYYQLIHNRKVKRINTDMRIHPEEWQLLCDKERELKGILLLIKQSIAHDTQRIWMIIQNCESCGKSYSVGIIAALFKRKDREVLPRAYYKVNPVHTSSKSFRAFMQERIQELKEEKRNGTAENYRHTLNSLVAFTGNVDITLPMITENFIERYEVWLKSRGLKRNSTSFYMRVLRAVYNRAVKQNLVQQTFPFRNVYTGMDKTRKRAVKEKVIITLKKLDLSDKPGLQLAKDLFLFSFATCGMPFVDMAYLKKSNIRDGYIRYERRKTGQSLQVKVLPFIKYILKKYEKGDSTYVFPVITTTDSELAYHQYRNALISYNHYLRKLSTMLPEPAKLTSYVSRHSWATIARAQGYSISRIGKALGHTNESTTEIYLGSIGESEVDKMNENIIRNLQS